MVGVDGSPGSVAALRWALAEARLRGARVRVVHAFPHPRLPATEAGLGAAGGMGIPAVYVEEPDKLRQAVEAEARHVIDETLRAAGAADSEGVPVETVAREGPAAQTLIEAGREAELLVVGSRGRGGFVGLVLGSVSQQCAQHPPCPVVILPPPEHPEGDAT